MYQQLLILATCAAICGFLSTLITVISISVDDWQHVSFLRDVIDSINRSQSDITITSLSDHFQLYEIKKSVPNLNSSLVFYVHPSTIGLWRACDNLSDKIRKQFEDQLRLTITYKKCFVFVADYDEDDGGLTADAKQIARLHNTAASSYVVVIIDLFSAFIIGTIGIVNKQVICCMVTGVLCLVAALFSSFGLAMFHTKHYYQAYECTSLDVMPESLCNARQVSIMYAIPLAWLGVVLCFATSILWFVIARMMRVILTKTMI